ncbi:hydroxyurea phosphotransferase [Dictyobacter alpinus]|uniref:Hydroxyurea phosphotransferase n=1 Tax=Dictyobacter alpinus TaxID=2014873 RepID=A0A402BJW0_9CHLR|nr:aminoglycoside phosphotransferase family protein [Dictyobacter alpinus]GCE31641.1 hydroxyurea phosphotransferase [Dictyobacter alpinus]
MFIMPDNFMYRASLSYDATGTGGIERLHAALKNCEARWNLTLEQPFNLSFNYVAPARRADGTPVVIKVCLPSDEFALQHEALRICDGHGMVRLLDAHDEDETMLLERLEPGHMLSTVEDDAEAFSQAAAVMRQIRQPVPAQHSFPSIQDWGRGLVEARTYYSQNSGPIPLKLLDEACRLFAELAASQAEPVVLHGDLHQENILSAERAPWLAIDPKGVIGEPAYETGSLLRNETHKVFNAPQPIRVMARRVDQLAAELGFERERIRGWALAQAVLSVWWDFDEPGFPNVFDLRIIATAELLAQIKS